MTRNLSAPDTRGALQGVRIVDLCGTIGQSAGRYLADLGADVILVEPPGGSPSRFLAPRSTRGTNPDRSLYFLHANTNKRSVVLDLSTDQGRRQLNGLLESADAVLESLPGSYPQARGIDYASLSERNPRVVLTSISPFGETGPYRDFRSADIVVNAIGGLIHAEGEPQAAPLNPPRYQAYQMGGLHAAFGTLIALWERETTGLGQHVEVSLQEVAAHQHMAIVRYASGQEISARRPNRGSTGPSQYYRTKDGWVMLALTSGRQWVEFAAWTGDPILMEKSYEILANRDVHYDLIDEKCAAFVARFTTEEFLREGSARRVTVAPANTPAAFMNDAHALARGYFREVDHPTLGRYVAPGAGAEFSATPWAVRRPAPTLGQHTAEVLGEVASGLSRRDQQRPVAAAKSDDVTSSALPLEGIRILAFSRVWAAPFGTRFLADYGAEVIKVESTQFPDGRLWDVNTNPAAWRMGHATFGEINRNKKSVSLDLHSPVGQDLFKRLAAEADIVVENNAPSAMARFGVDYDALRAVKPDIIMV
ncbi:MAG: CoA transferase, partial [Chloroflexi bacterium]|nr:CoA transferase [Chloroflexota bacterium]